MSTSNERANIIMSKNTRKYANSEDAGEGGDSVSKEPTKAQLAFENATGILKPLLDNGERDENELGKALIMAGVGFGESKNLLKKVLEASGIKMSASDRYELVSAALTERLFAPKEYSEVDAAITHFVKELDATNEVEARRAIERWAKKNDVTLPERPRGRKGGGVSGSVRRRVYAEALRLCTEADGVAFNKFISELDEGSQNAGSVSVYNSIAELCRMSYAKDR